MRFPLVAGHPQSVLSHLGHAPFGPTALPAASGPNLF